MARINVDDELFADYRFKRLVRKLGEDQALGMLLRFWRIAQKYWGDDRSLVSRHEFDAEDLQPVLESGLAIARGQHVYACGAEERFAWYLQRCQNGRKRSQSTRSEEGQFQKDDQQKDSSLEKEPAKTDLAGENNQPPVSAPVSAPVPYRTDLKEEEEEERDFSNLLPELNLTDKRKGISKGKPQLAVVPNAGQFVAAYIEAYGQRYDGARPQLTGKTLGEIKSFLKSVPIDRACNLIQVYCQIDDKWFNKKMHDFTTFASNLNPIAYALDKGNQQGGTNWNETWKTADERSMQS